jgi:hypothetical protein
LSEAAKPGAPAADELHWRLVAAGDQREEIRALLAAPGLTDAMLLAALRRPLPARVLDVLADTPPWSNRTRLLGALSLNPGCSRALAQKLLPGLLWSDLATLAASPSGHGPVRVRAEALLKDRLIELRLGDRMSLARRATSAVLRPLLQDAERQVVRAALLNPRLREDDLVACLRSPHVSLALVSEIPASFRWEASYAVRRLLVLHPRTPLPVALAQVTRLRPVDQRRIASTEGLHPLLKAAARRALGEP